MKNLIHTVFFLFSLSAAGQSPYSIAHFQKKVSIEELVLPGDLYDPSNLLVLLPDSTYDSGMVNIRKLKCKKIKLKNYNYSFSNDSIDDVIFSVRGKRMFNELKLLLAYNIESIPELTGDKVSSKVMKKSDSKILFLEFVRIRNNYFFSLKKK